MSLRAALVTAALVAMPSCTTPPPVPSATPVALAAHQAVPPMVRAGLASREARRLAASLADEVGPRLAGSPGDALAVAWAERAMKAIGLTSVHAEPVVVPVWRRGTDRAVLVEPTGTRTLDVAALGWSGATGADGIEAEVVRVPDIDALRALPDSAVRGKIVFVDAAMKRTPTGEGYGQAVPVRYRAPKEAAERGAVAALIRSVGTDAAFPHTGSTSRAAVPALPVAALSNASADALAAALSAGPRTMRLTLTSSRPPDARSANVVGEVRGTTKPEEVVLLAAHLDAWDTGRGAVDDGAGCGIVMDAARIASTAMPGRTIRVVLFAAEENSLAGAKAYVREHAAEVDAIVLAIEIDSGADRARSVRFSGDPAMRDALRRAVEPLGAQGVAWEDERAHGGADIGPLLERGVPVIDVRQDVSRYFDLHHTPSDTSDKLDAEAMAQVTAVVAHLALFAADPARRFGRVAEGDRHRD